MPLLVENLHQASFKGVQFFIEDASTTFGNKTVDHEYPNSSMRYVENLGTNSKVYTIVGIVHGDNYLQDRDRLLQVLEDGSIGVLIHPFYGIKLVVAKSGTIEETISNLGIARITMVFSTSVPAIFPGIGKTLDSLIIAASDLMNGSLVDSFSHGFGVSGAYPGNYFSAYNKLNSIGDQFDTFKTHFSESQDFSDLNNQQTAFKSTMSSNVRSPANLSNSISDLFAIANNASNDPKLTAQAFTKLFNFGKSDNPVDRTTRQGAERDNNIQIINYIFCAYALMYAYLNFSQSTFTDDLDLQTSYNLLEAQYLKIINGSVTDLNPANVIDILGSDTIDSLAKLRNLARQKYDEDSQNVAKITSVSIHEMPVTIISYLYYETTDQDKEILALNDINDVSFISGEIKVAIPVGLAA